MPAKISPVPTKPESAIHNGSQNIQATRPIAPACRRRCGPDVPTTSFFCLVLTEIPRFPRRQAALHDTEIRQRTPLQWAGRGLRNCLERPRGPASATRARMVAMVWAICSSTSTAGEGTRPAKCRPAHVRRRARRSGRRCRRRDRRRCRDRGRWPIRGLMSYAEQTLRGPLDDALGRHPRSRATWPVRQGPRQWVSMRARRRRARGGSGRGTRPASTGACEARDRSRRLDAARALLKTRAIDADNSGVTPPAADASCPTAPRGLHRRPGSILGCGERSDRPDDERHHRCPGPTDPGQPEALERHGRTCCQPDADHEQDAHHERDVGRDVA